MQRLMIAITAAGAGLLLASPAWGATATLSGAAAVQPNGTVRLVSNLTGQPDSEASAIHARTNLPFEALRRLSVEFNITDDDCRAESPHVRLLVGGQFVFVRIGPAPTYSGCPLNTWRTSPNLIGNNDECRWNTSRFAGGSQCHTFSEARQLLQGRRVTAVSVVVGGGFAFEDRVQTLVVRNLWINGRRLFAPLTPAVACRTQRNAMGATVFALHYRDTPTSFARCQGILERRQRNGSAAAFHAAKMTAARACRAEQRGRPLFFRNRYGTGAQALSRCIAVKSAAQLARSAATVVQR